MQFLSKRKLTLINVFQGTGEANTSSDESKKIGPYACDLCDKRFNHLSSVFYHKEAEHNDGIRFACNKCDKSFKHRQLLQRHQLVHTDDRLTAIVENCIRRLWQFNSAFRPFVCTLCSTSFKTKPNLTNHMLIHTGEKKYYCDLCGQQFAHKTSLVLHQRWHNGEKPFECKVHIFNLITISLFSGMKESMNFLFATII